MREPSTSGGASRNGAAEARKWLIEKGMPFWVAHGVDRARGGFVERFSLKGQAEDPGFKRCRVTARQIYVFSHATLLGCKDAGPIAESGYRWLIDRYLIGKGRWARKVSGAGEVIDTTQDLYDLAFALFALAWAYKALGKTEAVSLARETVSTLRATLQHPSGDGYLHVEGAGAPYEQNPHMHLLEAMLFLARFTGEDLFFEEARRIHAFARDRLIGREGVLAEFFDVNWKSPIVGARVEPGHHFEWTWLLKRYADLTGEREPIELAGILFDHAVRHGVDQQSGLVWDAISPEGAVTDRNHRIWPQLEAIKAWLAMEEAGRVQSGPHTRALVQGVMRHYLEPGHPGLWIDHVDERLAPRVEFAPTSTFYHVFLSFAELMSASALDLREA
jgi:mannose/cellobiose epimerase-like protein (N-acyl-D-glucosamine 2-epimerase family)